MAKRKQVSPKDIPVTRGSGNVYADLGFANPEEELAKAQLAMMIDDAIRKRRLTQQAAAKLMGIDQPKVSHILRGRLGGFSTQRLIDFLTALGGTSISSSRCHRARARRAGSASLRRESRQRTHGRRPSKTRIIGPPAKVRPHA